MNTKKGSAKTITKHSSLERAAASVAHQEPIVLAHPGKLSIDQLMTTAEKLHAAGKKSESIALYRAWLESGESPVKFVAWFNFGVQLAAQQDFEQAATAYRNALQLKHDFVQPRINLGLCLERLGKPHEGIAEWKRILDDPIIKNTATPELLTTALNHIGRVQEDLREYGPAEQSLTESLAINPRQKDVIHHWVHLRQKQCKWPVLQDLPGVSINQMIRAMSPLAMLAYADDPALQLLAAENCVRTKFDFPEQNLSKGRVYNHNRIRIGYLSGDLCTHAVGLLLPEVFENHDREKFEVFAYDYSRDDGTVVRQRIKSAIEHFISVGHLSDEQVAQQILTDEIDILVDLHGLSLGARPKILSFRAAPIQVTYLGYIGTTALPYVDYVIADEYALPPELSPFFSEKPIYLSCPILPGDSNRELGNTPTRTELGLPEHGFVFASFNNSYKLNQQMFDCWLKILERTPNSVLWLIDDNPWATANLRDRARNLGVSSERLVFTPRVLPADYRARMKLADLFLDNVPYNAGSTASDVVWMGLPMLTLSGNTFVSRMAGSLLHHTGVPELIARSYDEYADKAVQLATDRAYTANIKLRLQQYRSGRGQHIAHDFVKALEASFLNIVDQNPSWPSASTSVSNIKSTEIVEQTSNQVLKPTCALYQIAYSQATLSAVKPPFRVLNNLQNARPDWQEYWPIRNFLLSQPLDENCLYGFFSPRFTEKTGLTGEALEQFVLSNAGKADLITISPQPDMGAFFLNVFEQNELFDPGFMQTARDFIASCGLEISLQGLLMDSRTIVFSNYFVARPRFWRRWLDLNEKLFAICESPTVSPLQTALLTETSYRNVHRKVFLMERIASLIAILDPSFRVVTYDTFKCAWSGSRLGGLKSEAIISDALKIAKSATGHDVYISEFARIRKEI